MESLRSPFAVLAAGCLVAGCTFNSAGIAMPASGDSAYRADRAPAETAIPNDATGDSWRRDVVSAIEQHPARDASRTDGQLPKDTKPSKDTKSPQDIKPPKDLKLAPDSGGYKPVGTTELLAAWNGMQVKCIADDGSWNSTYIKILDNPTYAALVDGSITLAGATPDTKSWVGGKPSVTVIFDLNSCGLEDPGAGDNEWGSAGILIRGATLSGGQLVLSPGVTTADMDLLDVTASGDFEAGSDFAMADDSGLSSYPQLVPVVAALKQGILQAATK